MASETYRQRLTEDRRLVLLRLLRQVQGYSANSSILQDALEAYGHRVSRDQVHTDLAWLAEQELVTVEEIASVQVAKLTGRGDDVATGVSTVPGVKRPRPADGS